MKNWECEMRGFEGELTQGIRPIRLNADVTKPAVAPLKEAQFLNRERPQQTPKIAAGKLLYDRAA